LGSSDSQWSRRTKSLKAMAGVVINLKFIWKK